MPALLDDAAIDTALQDLPGWRREGDPLVLDAELPTFPVAIAAGNPDQSATLVIPTDEPALAGLTKTGNPSRWRCCAVRVLSAARNTTVSVTGRPWARRAAAISAAGSPMCPTVRPTTADNCAAIPAGVSGCGPVAT